MSGRLENALEQLSNALGSLEENMAKLPSISASSISETDVKNDSIKQQIRDIETMMDEAINLLEQTSSGEA